MRKRYRKKKNEEKREGKRKKKRRKKSQDYMSQLVTSRMVLIGIGPPMAAILPLSY